jgi:hypothetical protein
MYCILERGDRNSEESQGSLIWIPYETSKCAIEEEVILNIDLSPCNGYVTDFAKKRPITANGA